MINVVQHCGGVFGAAASQQEGPLSLDFACSPD